MRDPNRRKPKLLIIITQGGAFAGWSLYATAGRLRYCYNLLGLQRFKIQADAVIAPGTRQVRMEFAYDGGDPAKGGTVSLSSTATRPARAASRPPCRPLT